MKKYGMLIVFALMLGAAGLVMLGKRDDRADLSAVMEMVSDAQQDVAKTGNTLLRLSDEEENELGREIVRREFLPERVLPELASYVTAVAQPLLANVQRPGIKYTFHVLDTSGVNAFALPGGQIFVFRGLLNFVENEAELASIIGHEIAHVDLRHCVEMFLLEVNMQKIGGLGHPRNLGDLILRIPGTTSLVLNRLMQTGYRRFQEFDADAEGLNLLSKAGYQPEAAVSAMKRLQDAFDSKAAKPTAPVNPLDELAHATLKAAGDYFKSHPPTVERVQRLKAKAGPGASSETGYRGKENLHRRISRSQQEFPGER